MTSCFQIKCSQKRSVAISFFSFAYSDAEVRLQTNNWQNEVVNRCSTEICKGSMHNNQFYILKSSEIYNFYCLKFSYVQNICKAIYIMCFELIYPAFPHLAFISPFHPISSQFHMLFILRPVSSVRATSTSMDIKVVYWTIGSLSGSTSLNKTASPFPSIYKFSKLLS